MNKNHLMLVVKEEKQLASNILTVRRWKLLMINTTLFKLSYMQGFCFHIDGRSIGQVKKRYRRTACPNRGHF